MQFVDDVNPERQFLLDDRQSWHSIEHQWGSGHLVTDRGTHRWLAPAETKLDSTGAIATHILSPALRLDVTRVARHHLVETYRFTNPGPDSIEISGLGIQTPFADLYASSEHSLRHAVHAHVFTGGSWAWVLAQPMDGSGRVLGVVLRDGGLHSYSIESRNQFTSSNVRGHIVLQPTDHARNPDCFGGQPTFRLEPGQSHVLRWEIGFHDTAALFLATTNPPASFSQLSAPVGSPIRVIGLAGPISVDDPSVRVDTAGGEAILTAGRPGVHTVRIGGARTEIAFHRSVKEVVQARVDYILANQVTRERPGLLRFGIVGVDVRTRLRQQTNGWPDWTDGSERIGMAILLQQARARGWADDRVDDLLDGWARLAENHLLDDTAAPRRGSQDRAPSVRLYDSPWLAQFFVDRFNLLEDHHHLDLAARILERAFALGGDRFLAIGFSEACLDVIIALSANGENGRAEALSEQLVESARHFLAAGIRLPEHEVNYEQSIVAPLISLFIDAHRLTGDPAFVTAISDRLPWLLAFGGPQPHVRLAAIAIRHWDGYWFGIERLWGDVFPHYWSALTAGVLYRLPPELRTAVGDATALAILRANLVNYFDDGSATCAFVMPSTVDGRAAHMADPLANDQDWQLSIWLRLADRCGTPLA